MAYQTGSATDATDLMSKLSTFAQANGFTEDYYNGTNKFLSLSRPALNLYVSFQWNANYIALYQALGYSGGSAETPWLQVNDSGNGSDNFGTYPDRGRQVTEIGAGPFTAYHFFAHDNPYNVYVVLEFSPGLYRHFGFGFISKTGIWTGGAWCAGHLWNKGGSVPYGAFSSPDHSGHSVLMDTLTSQNAPYFGTYNTNAGGTLHVQGLPGMSAASKWGQSMNNGVLDVDFSNDRAGNPRVRILGGCRGGPAMVQFGRYLPNLSNGFIPIIPMEIFYCRGESAANGWYFLGMMHNVGHIHLQGIDPATELTVGADTWIAFPMVRKANVGGTNQESENAGIIYKKVT